MRDVPDKTVRRIEAVAVGPEDAGAETVRVIHAGQRAMFNEPAHFGPGK
jgi:hypothetical protein